VPERSEARLLLRLKSAGPQAAAAIGRRLGITAVAARQQLAKLEVAGLVRRETERGGVGRPRHLWSLTDKGHARFPDGHAELTLDLIRGIRKVFGLAGLDRLIAARQAASLQLYRARLGAGSLRGKVLRLAALRSEEGYMAQAAPAPGGGYILRENHCPICVAARACQGLCRSELALFRAALGPGVEVERHEHILAGARRCAYRIRAQAG